MKSILNRDRNVHKSLSVFSAPSFLQKPQMSSVKVLLLSCLTSDQYVTLPFRTAHSGATKFACPTHSNPNRTVAGRALCGTLYNNV